MDAPQAFAPALLVSDAAQTCAAGAAAALGIPAASTHALQLGNLPYDLASKILLQLPWLERVRLEHTCKAWLRLFRQPSLWEELHVDDGIVGTSIPSVPNDSASLAFLASYATHVPGALRVVRVTGKSAALCILLMLARTGPPDWSALPQLVPQLSRVTLRTVTLSVASALPLAAGLAALPCLEELHWTLEVLKEDSEAALRELFATPLRGCCANVVLSDDLFLLTDEEAEADDGGTIPRRLAAVARALRGCAWSAVRLYPEEYSEVDFDSAFYATLCTGFLAAVHPTPSTLREFEVSRFCFGADEVGWIAAAAAPPLRIRHIELSLSQTEVRHLAAALRPGTVFGACLTLIGGPWALPELQLALDAVRAASAASAAAGTPFVLWLTIDGPPFWSRDAAALLVEFLRDSGARVERLALALDAPALALVLPELPATLEELDLQDCAPGSDACVRALCSRITASELGNLRRLALWPLSADGARAMKHVLPLLPELQIYCNVLSDEGDGGLSAALALLSACQWYQNHEYCFEAIVLRIGMQAAASGDAVAFTAWRNAVVSDGSIFVLVGTMGAAMNPDTWLFKPPPPAFCELRRCMCIHWGDDSFRRTLCNTDLLAMLAGCCLTRQPEACEAACALLLPLLCCDAAVNMCDAAGPSPLSKYHIFVQMASEHSDTPELPCSATLCCILLLFNAGPFAAMAASASACVAGQPVRDWLRGQAATIRSHLVAALQTYLDEAHTPLHAAATGGVFWTLSDIGVLVEAACAVVPSTFAAPAVSELLVLLRAAHARAQAAAEAAQAAVRPGDDGSVTAAKAAFDATLTCARLLVRVFEALRDMPTPTDGSAAESAD